MARRRGRIVRTVPHPSALILGFVLAFVLTMAMPAYVEFCSPLALAGALLCLAATAPCPRVRIRRVPAATRARGPPLR